MGKLYEARGLSKYYGKGSGKTLALDNVNLDINEGEIFVILGSSGSGKTTLLNLLGAMDKPDTGEIFFHGDDISKLNDNGQTSFRREKISFVFQAFNLIGELTALENVDLTADTDAKLALKSVGLEGKENNYPSELSGGQQQRVSIARAIAKKNEVLLCDEPTGALDYETGKQILALLEDLARKENKTIVIVTHTKEIAKMADRYVVMRSGKIIERVENQIKLRASEIEW